MSSNLNDVVWLVTGTDKSFSGEKMAKILYVAIGNEILMGKTVNTNESFIGEHLVAAGIPLDLTITVKDDVAMIANTLNHYWEQYDVIIMSGGLGPTHDDVTKHAMCAFFGKKLIFHNDIWEKIQKMYANKSFDLPEIAKTQAEVPQDFTPLNNTIGTAPGLYFYKNSKHFFAVPGVPSEMRFIFEDSILPLLLENYHPQPLFQRTIRTIGIPESILSTSTQQIKETQKTKIAFLPKPGMVDIRVYGTSEDEVSKIVKLFVQHIPQQSIYGFDNDTIEGIFHKKMMASGKTLSTAESCTGGLIQSLITDNAGSSEYFKGGVVSYSNEAKMEILGVRKATLSRYGAVSRETVKEMVLGAKELIGTDYAIAVSGIAGPDGGTNEKPVGLVYIGTWGKTGLVITKNNFSGTRIEVKNKTALYALRQLEVEI